MRTVLNSFSRMAGIHESGLAVLPFGNVRGCNEPGISELKFVAYIK